MSTCITIFAHPHSQSSGLERIISTQSSFISESSDAAGSTNAYSTATSDYTDLMTPVHRPSVDDRETEEELTDQEADDMYAEAEAARQRLAAVGTQSMQNLKKGKGRERSMTDTRAAPPALLLAPPVPSHPPTAIRPPQPPIITSKPAKASGSFSAFLRRLTGKGPKKQKHIPAAPSPGAHSAPTPPGSIPSTRPQATRQETAPIPSTSAPPPRQTALRQNSMPSRPILHPLDTKSTVRAPQPLSAPSRPPPRAPTVQETDPINIPLPPSPVLSPMYSDEDLIDLTSPVPSLYRPQQQLHKQPAMLSLQGFAFDEDETDEEADEAGPLRPLRIAVGDSRRRSLSPESAPLKSSSSAETTLQTPLSAAAPNHYSSGGSGSGCDSSPEKSGKRLAGSTPPRKAPIGTGFSLERKESKWRKSVMGLDNVARKPTTRLPPPSSHDAHMTQQRRMKNNRTSCQPTLHSNASIAAELTAIKSKEEQDVAETFFLS